MKADALGLATSNSRINVFARLILASIFVVAGGLKINAVIENGLNVDGMLPPFWQVVVGFLELSLAWSLVSAGRSIWPVVTAAAFSLLAWLVFTINLFTGWQCGCFGNIDINYQLKAIILLAMSAAAIRLVRTETLFWRSAWRNLRPPGLDAAIQLLLKSGVWLLVFAVLAWLATDDVWRRRIGLPPPRLVVEGGGHTAQLGNLPRGVHHNCVVTLTNPSMNEILLVGARVSCKCIAVSDFPIVLSPAGKCHLSLTISPQIEGDFEHVLQLFARDFGSPLRVVLRGRVVAQSAMR